MTQRNRIREGITTLLFMLGVTFVWISVVSGLHLATQERVRINESLYLKKALMQAVGVPVPADGDRVATWYRDHVTAFPDDADPTRFEVRLPTERGGTTYAFVVNGSGLWGTITAVIGVESDLRTLAGASFLKHNETPGLGARISEAWFTDQLVGKQPPVELVPEETQSEAPGRIDAITGATITSKAVQGMLQRTVERADREIGAREGSG